ncbi:hypothetical protein MMC07_004692 [Pseudocyphellaria aurata]|nr:hypothetical protein [Pseudocyphellaria aurata]
MTLYVEPWKQPMLTSELQKANLEAKIAALESRIADVQAQEQEIRTKLKSPLPAATTVQRHIQLLHAYNETRDLATGLMGILADNRGVRACDIHAQFGVRDEAS